MSFGISIQRGISMFKRLDTKKRREARLYNTLRAIRFQILLVVLLIYSIPTLFVAVAKFFRDKGQTATEQLPKALWQTFLEQMKHPTETVRSILERNELTIITALIVCVLLGLLLSRFSSFWRRFRPHEVEDASDYGAYDTAKWATGKEVLAESDFTSSFKDEKTFGALIGKTVDTKDYIVRKCISALNGHTFGVAGSGKGKTTGYILNQVILNKTRSSVSSDGKGEIYKLTSKRKKEEGYEILYIDFVKFLGDRWNPLTELTFDDIDNFSTNLVQSALKESNDVWGANAINLISACIAYLFENESECNQNMGTVRELINLGEQEIKTLFSELSEDSVAKSYFSDVQSATDKTWTGIETTAKSATRFWKQKRIQTFTERSDFRFTDLGIKKIAMYIRIHPTDKTYEVLQNTFFKQMFNKLIEEAETYGGRYPVEIDFQLDEFTNIGKVPGIQEVVSYVRSLGLNISMFVQNITQLYSTYGKEDAESLMSNCDNFVFLGTNDSKVTAPYIKEKLGETTKIIRDNTGKAKDTEHVDDSMKYTYIKRGLLSVSEIIKFPPALGIYFHPGGDPLMFKKVFSYELFPNLEESELGWHIDFEKRKQENREPATVTQVNTVPSPPPMPTEPYEVAQELSEKQEVKNEGEELPYL